MIRSVVLSVYLFALSLLVLILLLITAKVFSFISLSGRANIKMYLVMSAMEFMHNHIAGSKFVSEI